MRGRAATNPTNASGDALSALELSVRVVRPDGSVPFESSVRIPIGDGRDHDGPMRSWLDMIHAGLAIQQQVAS